MSKSKAMDGVVTFRDSLVVIDSKTGEVLDVSTKKKVKYKTGAYYLKTFYENPMFREEIPHSARTLLFALAGFMPYADSDSVLGVTITPMVKKELVERFGLSAATIKRNLTILLEKDFIRRVCRGVYEVNPYLYAKGTSPAVLRLQKLWDVAGGVAEPAEDAGEGVEEDSEKG